LTGDQDYNQDNLRFYAWKEQRMSAIQHGYFLIADITGYTMYLSQSELDHAQGTLTALLELLIDHTRPPLIISRLAGDAVISYGLRDNFFQGQTFIEMIEDTYVAFRKAIALMVMNNTCQCNACANVGSLDLKFFVHYGSFGVQKLDQHDELVGADVIVIHRLLKNHVTEKTGFKAYSLYSDTAIQQLGLADICATMTPHIEEYEHLGEVKAWVQDMHPVWQAKKDQTRIHLRPEEIFLQVGTDIHLPPELVWDYLIQPEHFNVLAGGSRTEIAQRKEGRITVGTIYQCFHGDTLMPQTILEWQPFERSLVQALLPIPVKNTFFLVELRLEPTPQGTRLLQVFGKITGPLPGRLVAKLFFKLMAKAAQRDIDNFKKHIEDDHSQRDTIPEGASVTPELVNAAVSASLAG
jgi:hypothetical protein